jgi:hypothetical protein
MALLRFFNLSLSWREWEATVAARGQSASLTAELLRAVVEWPRVGSISGRVAANPQKRTTSSQLGGLPLRLTISLPRTIAETPRCIGLWPLRSQTRV